jgi:hypothetical protein
MIEANRFAAEQRWQAAQDALKRNLRLAFPGAPTLSSNAIKAMLQYSATRIHDGAGVTYGPLEQGAGLVNGLGAIALAYSADTTKLAGEYWTTFPMPPATDFGGVSEPWSQTVICGTRFLHGTSIVDVRQEAWAENIVWGTGELDNMVSGSMSAGHEDNIVWGTFADEDNIVWGTSFSPATDLMWAGNALLEDNIVWATAMTWDDNVVWGTSLIGFFDGTAVVWGTMSSEDNIVWGTLSEDNIVWGTSANKVSVLGASIGGAL